MLIHRWDDAKDEREAREFLASQGFGHLIASGRGRDIAVVVPTQFALDEDNIVLHLAKPNPVWTAIEENSAVVLSIAGDWAYIPSAWKATNDEDPTMGIPTTYYAAVQITARAEIVDDPEGIATILRHQLNDQQPGMAVADPLAHGPKLATIRGLRLTPTEIRAKFKYGANVDIEHRIAVAAALEQRNGPGDAAARAHLLRRLDAPSGT